MTKKNGRPLYDLTDERFATIVGMMKIQCTQDEICAIFELDEKTLNVPLKKRGEDRFYTTQKPVALAMWFFENWGKGLFA